MIRAYKYRLYPSAEQKAYFARCFGATRYCYNFCVREYDAACKAGRQLSGFDIAARLREHMRDVEWMANVDYEIKESAPRRFDNALGKFKRHEANRPREHKKGDRPTMSYTTEGAIKVDFKHDLVQLPKIGVVSARLHRTFCGDITSATIKREADGHYYVCLNVNNDEAEVPLKPHTTEGTIGIDVGIRHLATLSNGDHFEMPDTSRITDRITFLKNRLEKQTPGSRRYNRTAFQIAKYHHHIANIAKETHHKAAAKLCHQYDTICMETLNVAGMKRGQRGEKTAADLVFNAQLHRTALALFIDRIQKKAEDTGTNFVGIDRFEPTTKMCHVCGHVLDSISLDVEAWTCPECGTRHDRDLNAAINIRNKGLAQLQAKPPKASRIKKLPLAEGNVKPAKKTTAGCNLRTGKRKAEPDQPPKAQIADGSAPPRIFKEPARPRNPLDPDHPFRYFKLLPLGDMVGKHGGTVKKWIEESRFIDPTPEDRELTIKLLKAIKKVADSLRQLRMTEDTPAHTQLMLGKMNKVVHADRVIKEHISFDCTFTTFRAKRLSPGLIQEINQWVTVDFANRLDAAADRFLRPLLPQPEHPKKGENRPLRRVRKYDPTIIPLEDDPALISYEEQILTVIPAYFIRRRAHILQFTFDRIVGEGTIFRPKNCSLGRMSTFISALYEVADEFAAIDSTVEGFRNRLDQLYNINMKYVNLTEIVRRYIDYGDNAIHIYFKRAGKTTTYFYNEHYPEIMRVITYDLPKLIRDAAAYLAKVYQINPKHNDYERKETEHHRSIEEIREGGV